MGTVLVIDDDEAFADIVSVHLKTLGHEVLHAPTANRGTHLLSQCPIDLAIVDGLLPDMDGVKWIERTRKTYAALPMVMVSAFSIYRDRKMLLHLTQDLGVRHVVAKPVVPVVFAQQMSELLPAPVVSAEVGIEIDEADFDAELKKLEEQYSRELPEKIALMRGMLNAAKADSAQLPELAGAAHRLRGSAGTYGRDDVSVSAGHIEDFVKGLGGKTADADGWRTLDSMIISLETVAGVVDHVLLDVEPLEEELEIAEALPLLPTLLLVGVSPEDKKAIDRLARELRVELAATDDILGAASLARSLAATAVILAPKSDSDTGAIMVADALRTLPETERPNIALIAPADTREMRMLALQSGASAFTSRPLRPEHLRQQLRKVLTLGDTKRPHVLLGGTGALALKSRLGQERVRLSVAADGIEVLDIFEQDPPHLAILDAMLPRVSGFDLCRMLQTVTDANDVPLWLYAPHSKADVRLAGFRAGADDVLLDPLDVDELAVRISHRTHREQHLRERRAKDLLTGLYHRQALYRLAPPLLRRGAALVRLKIMDFGGLNARHGHELADHVLASIGELMASRARPEDLAARSSSSEFVLVLAHEREASAQELASRWVAELSRERFDGDVRVSFETRVFETPRDGDDLDKMLA